MAENNLHTNHESNWDKTKKAGNKAWDKTKEVSSDAWDATKEGAAKAKDKITH